MNSFSISAVNTKSLLTVFHSSQSRDYKYIGDRSTLDAHLRSAPEDLQTISTIRIKQTANPAVDDLTQLLKSPNLKKIILPLSARSLANSFTEANSNEFFTTEVDYGFGTEAAIMRRGSGG